MVKQFIHVIWVLLLDLVNSEIKLLVLVACFGQNVKRHVENFAKLQHKGVLLDYRRIYWHVINSAIERDYPDHFFETHHIIPRSEGRI